MNYKICDASRITQQASSTESAASGSCSWMIVNAMSEGPDRLTQTPTYTSQKEVYLINRILHMIIKLVGAVNDLLWGDLIILEFSGGDIQFGLSLLVLILIPAGLYFTFKTRFLPFRLFPEMIRVTLEKDETKKDENSISGVQALIVATATRVGMGNLAGVVAAISFGGAGAVFWMWLTALIGSSSSFIESTLSRRSGLRNGPYPTGDKNQTRRCFRKERKRRSRICGR